MASINVNSTPIAQTAALQGIRPSQAGVSKSDTAPSAAQAPDEAVFSSQAQALAAAETTEQATIGPKPEAELPAGEKKGVADLKARDIEVRADEQAHLNALGGKGGSANFQFTTGPDGRRYVSGGEVAVTVGESAAGPGATIQDAQQVARAAVAPAQPSSADQAVRAKALQVEAKARQELKAQKSEGGPENAGDTNIDGAAQAAQAAQGLINNNEAVENSQPTGAKAGETDDNGRTEPTASALNQPSS